MDGQAGVEGAACDHAWAFVPGPPGGREIRCARCGLEVSEAARRGDLRSQACAHAWDVLRRGVWWRLRCARCGVEVERTERPPASGNWNEEVRWPEGEPSPFDRDPRMEQAGTRVEVMATQLAAQEAVRRWEREDATWWARDDEAAE